MYEKTDENNETTFFKNVKYKGFYDLDKPFTIKSSEAYMLNAEPNIIYMSNMHVILYLDNNRIINITSDQGKYNKLSYDCFFEKNVVVDDKEIKISAENFVGSSDPPPIIKIRPLIINANPAINKM